MFAINITIVGILIMTLQEKYVEAVIRSLSPFRKHKFRDGNGYKFACPFCRDAQRTIQEQKVCCYLPSRRFFLLFLLLQSWSEWWEGEPGVFSNDEVQHPSEEVESTPLSQIHQGEGGGKTVSFLVH